MTNSFASLLRRIEGRFKKNMFAILLTCGSVFIPLGAYLFIDNFKPVWASGGILIIGLLFVIAANIWWVFIEKPSEDRKNAIAIKQRDDINKALHELTELIKAGKK